MAARMPPKVVPINREDDINADIAIGIYVQASLLFEASSKAAMQIKCKRKRELILEAIGYAEITLEDLSTKKS